MQQAARHTQSSQREATELIAQQRKAREEQEAREAKDREARKAQVARELEARRRALEVAEDEARRRAKREQERVPMDGDRAWAAAALMKKGKASSGGGSSSPSRAGTSKTVRQAKERSDQSRVSAIV